MFFLVERYISQGLSAPKEIVEGASMEDFQPYSSCTSGFETEAKLRERCQILDDPCKECGGLVSAQYDPKTKARIVDLNLCFTCQYWEAFTHSRSLIIAEGSAFTVCPDTTDTREAGFGGDRFRITKHTGEIIETNNLWHRGVIPHHFRSRMADNAELERLPRFTIDSK